PRDLLSLPTSRSSDLDDGRSRAVRADGVERGDGVERRADGARVRRAHPVEELCDGRDHGLLVGVLGEGGERGEPEGQGGEEREGDRKSTRLNSSHVKI